MTYKNTINTQELAIEKCKTSFNLKPKLIIHFHIYVWYSDADNCSFMKWTFKLNVLFAFVQEAVLECLELLASKVMFISKYLKNSDHWKFTQRNGIYYC